MSIQNLILGNLVSRGADRLLNPNRINKNKFNLLTGGGYTGEGDENKNTGSKTLGGIAKTGIMSLIAQAILGPIFGPLALTLGTNFMDRRNQRLGLNEDPTQTGPRGGITATGIQFENIQDTLGSTDSGTDIDYNTGDITDKSTGITTGNVYDEVALTGGDSSSDSGSNGGGGGGGNMSASDFSDDTAGTPFRYGGLASLYR
jgi:hypothetical protein